MPFVHRGRPQRKEEGMHRIEYSNMTIDYYDEDDLAPCRACGVKPDMKGTSSDGA